MNPFVRRIGIWYKDIWFADEIYENLIKDIPQDSIYRAIKSKNNIRIELKDGSFIQFVYASESNRGKCFGESYVQLGIKPEIINMVIKPCTKVHPYNCYVIAEYKHLFDFERRDIKQYLKAYNEVYGKDE